MVLQQYKPNHNHYTTKSDEKHPAMLINVILDNDNISPQFSETQLIKVYSYYDADDKFAITRTSMYR